MLQTCSRFRQSGQTTLEPRKERATVSPVSNLPTIQVGNMVPA